MSRPATKADHRAFCEREGWEPVKMACGRDVGHHLTYEFVAPSGERLRTRISRPADSTTYGPSLWRHVLGQLDVTEDEFWQCVDKRVLPDRLARSIPDVQTLPLPMLRQLESIGVPTEEAVVLTVKEATARIAAYWTARAGE